MFSNTKISVYKEICRLKSPIRSTCLVKLANNLTTFISRKKFNIFRKNLKYTFPLTPTTVGRKLSICHLTFCIFWKFQHFSITDILREINFGECKSLKKCDFCNFRGSEFFIWVNFSLRKRKNLKKYITISEPPDVLQWLSSHF